ncbi:hypothetical protein FC26_GL000778 [Paucilactobacillus vaccinostercus DSM 20634]|uniref:Uncharacterized protein n=1 Tax=Paucilactobacillus vaccinostercus DSM 20634 TaxID=1423813 RepID=A0A0R2ABY8_9LACO|nr:hypothetical protein [Paucilactobacillus vaccinostercus]KRM60348.1 hypothetical protein FC26_GL000778 [Paucilactobacillus vaccinostercus DSM 20634]
MISQKSWFNFFTTHIFAFGRVDGPTYTTRMYFNSNGRIGGYTTNNEYFWQLDETGLVLQNGNHAATTHFTLDEFPRVDNEMVQISGQYLPNSSVQHRITVVSIDRFYDAQARTMREDLQKTIGQGVQPALNRAFAQAETTMAGARTHHKIRLAFILNSRETLPAVLPLLNATRDDQRFEVKLVLTNKYYLGTESLETFEPIAAYFDEHHIGYVNAANRTDCVRVLEMLKIWQADFIVRQSEWEQDFPPEFGGRQLNWSRLIYIPYVITENMIKSAQRQDSGLLFNDYYRYIWRYFMADPLTVEQQYQLESGFISSEIFQSVGSMKAVEIKNEPAQWPLDMKNCTKKMVWIAHHSIGNHWFNMGSFPRVYQEMIDWARTHQSVSILFNPHPLLEATIKAGEFSGYTLEDYQHFLEQWQQLPNTGVLTKKSQYGATQAADLVFTDGVSSLYEMQIQGKPIVTLARHDQVGFTALGQQLMRGVHVTHTMAAAFEQIEQLLDHEDDRAELQVQNVHNWIKNDHPEVNIMDEMVREIDSHW